MTATNSLPQVDLTVFNAVQSLFSEGSKDPWGRHLAAELADFLIWNDRVRIPALVVADPASPSEGIVVPSILADLRKRESDAFLPNVTILAEPKRLLPELLVPAVKEFGIFALNNSSDVSSFLRVHSSSWIKDQVRSRLRTGNYVFDVSELAAMPEAKALALRLGVPNDGIPYLLDLILKYLIYAEQAEGEYYLSHPIRRLQPFKYLGPRIAPIDPGLRRMPFHLGRHLVAANRFQDQDWFTSRIYEARSYLRESAMSELADPRAVGKDARRRLAARLGLPAHVRRFNEARKAVTVASSVSGTVGSLTAANLWPAIVGCSVTISTTLWTGNLPGRVSNLGWLQWMLEWPLENDQMGRLEE